jgi:hypothetical protein
MSKVKSPKQKKALSLKRDRRNSYGESPHASRKAIPRRKQLTHQAERRAVAQELGALGAAPSEDDAIEQEGRAKTAARLQILHGFKKKPDAPLEQTIAKKKSRRKAD